jgi:hypothetical protein
MKKEFISLVKEQQALIVALQSRLEALEAK